MPLVTAHLAPGRLGLLLPPVAPSRRSAAAGRTSGTTVAHPFGSTQWVSAVSSGAEDAGAAGIWVSDHLFWGRPATECLTALAVAAAATRTATVGSCVLQLPLRAPAAVAKQASALQVLSGGRFVLGVGVGSHPGEYEQAGVPFHTRGRALDAGLLAVHDAWATARRTDGYRLEPAPPVAVWVGGSSPAALRRAAVLGDGWVPLFVSPDQFADGLGRIRDLALEAGRDPAHHSAAAVIAATVGEDPAEALGAGTEWLSRLYGIPAKAFERHLVAGPAEQCAARAQAYVDAGASHVIVMVAADDVLGQFRALTAAFDRLADPARPRELAEVGA